jgi:hypothetical protein
MPYCLLQPGGFTYVSTFETTHLTDIYSKKSLDELINEYGTHIGHTYILNDLPYINHIFDGKKDNMRLSKKWVNFTELLSDCVNNSLLWNPNMGEYIEYISLLTNVSVDYISYNKISIRNNNPKSIEGYTLIIPATIKDTIYFEDNIMPAQKSDSNYHFFVFTLPEKKTITCSFFPKVNAILNKQ